MSALAVTVVMVTIMIRDRIQRLKEGRAFPGALVAPYPFAFSDENSSYASFGLAFLCTTALIAAIIACGASD